METEQINDRELLKQAKGLLDSGATITKAAQTLGVEPKDLYDAAARNGYRLARRAVLEPIVPVELG